MVLFSEAVVFASRIKATETKSTRSQKLEGSGLQNQARDKMRETLVRRKREEQKLIG